MTKLKRIAMILFLVFTSFGMNVVAGPGVKILKDGKEKSMILNFFDWKSQTAQIKILDQQGLEVWANEIPVKHVTSIKYNLKDLPQGAYWLYIGSELSITIQPIEINETEIAFDEELRKEVYQPVIQLKGDILDFNQLTLGNETKIQFFDSRSNILYNEVFTDTTQIEKRFNLKYLDKGKYQVMVSTQGEQFVKSFTLN